MLCASIVQELNSGNGAMSVNVLTGEFRMFMSDSTGQGSAITTNAPKATTRMGCSCSRAKERRSIRDRHDMTKSQTDEMKRNSGFKENAGAVFKMARRQMFRLRKRAKGRIEFKSLRLRVRTRTASATSGRESRTAQWEEMQRAENSPP